MPRSLLFQPVEQRWQILRRCTERHTHANIFSNPNRDCYAYGYVYVYTNSNVYSHADGYTNSHADGDCHTNCNSHSYCNRNAYGHTDRYGDDICYANSYGEAFTNTKDRSHA